MVKDNDSSSSVFKRGDTVYHIGAKCKATFDCYPHEKEIYDYSDNRSGFGFIIFPMDSPIGSGTKFLRGKPELVPLDDIHKVKKEIKSEPSD